MRSPARLLVLAPLSLIAVWVAGPVQQADAEDVLQGMITEQHHAIEVVPGTELTTLEVTRTFFNPTFEHEPISLRLDLPCEAILDRLQLRGPDDARGNEVWVASKLVTPGEASDRYLHFQRARDRKVMEGDTIAVLSRSADCASKLELFPVPPMRERSVRYRIQLPSEYAEGRYTVQLPAFELELEGAQLSVADPPAGFEMAVNGVAVAGPVELSGRAPHSLTLTPVDAEHMRVSLASIDLRALGVAQEASSVVAAEIDLPMRLVDLPPVRRVVVLVDASHSLDSVARTNLQELAAAYLDALATVQPYAGVEVLEFDRDVRRVHGEFIDPELASGQLEAATIVSHNGSEPGLALAHARELLAAARQPGETGVDWLLLLSDLELRDEYSLAAELDAAEASEVRMHVIRSYGFDFDSLTPIPDDPWMAIAQATGGAHFGYSAREDWLPREESLARDGAELLEPNRVWDLRLRYTDDRGRTSVKSMYFGDTWVHAGESVLWLERLDTRGLDRVWFEASSWASPLTWSAKASNRARQRWVALLADDAQPLYLEDAELEALAELAGVVTQWTSMIAEATFDGPASMGTRWIYASQNGTLGPRMSSCRVSFRPPDPNPAFDLSVLHTAIEQALGDCRDLAPGSASFEILDTEIVAVESANACAREAIWQLDLRAWTFGHPMVQVAFDDRGVNQLQLTSLDSDALATFEE